MNYDGRQGLGERMGQDRRRATKFRIGTLTTEPVGEATRRASGPRICAEANIPARYVSFMRRRSGWDVLFIMEHVEPHRAPD